MIWASQVMLAVKNQPAKAGDKRYSLIPGSEDPLEKGIAIVSSILAWRTAGQGSLVATIQESHMTE